jgi:hypothetical protein
VEKEEQTGTKAKAYQLNLDPLIYGTIAEIGAGQEVARQFFRAGKASGTVAKTVSAYDMKMSDAIYGIEQSGRYVTRSRLENMLDTEYSLLIKRLPGTRPEGTAFFAFGDTVAAKTRESSRDSHGWMGLKFQDAAGADPSKIVVHVRMLDEKNRDQQECLGILGVNLIHSAFNLSNDPEALVDALIDTLEWGRIELNFIEFSGPAFTAVDNRRLNIRLVTSSLSPVVMFTPDGNAAMPADLLFRRQILLFRGSFRPFMPVHEDMIRCGIECFSEHLSTSPKNIIPFCEMNVARYLSEGLDEISDLYERVTALTQKGYHVMVTSHLRYFRLSEYFSGRDKHKIGFILSVDNIQTILDDTYYEGMEGGILEAMGKLFASDSTLLAYPNRAPDSDEIITIDNVAVPDHQKYLYRHLIHSGRILALRPDPETLAPFAPDPERPTDAPNQS